MRPLARVSRVRAARPRRTTRGPIGRVAQQQPLFRADDNGDGVPLPARLFGGTDAEGWGRAFESFRRLNDDAFRALAVSPRFDSTARGPHLKLYPSGSVGSIPLRSGTSGHVVAGFVVRPRFGWSGVGSILSDIGWHASPEVLALPLVPGSGREVPPWVLAGPVLVRLKALLEALKRGFDFRVDTLRAPRGTIIWSEYLHQSLPTGQWHRVPSRFPDLSTDPVVRGAVRWTVERVLDELTVVGGQDRIALELEHEARRLLGLLRDVVRVYPRPELLRRASGNDVLLQAVVRGGLEAIGWVRDERGLGGGRQMDGLAWSLALDRLWENYVEAQVRQEVRRTGGTMRIGRRGETLTALHWSDPSHRSLGHLVPDMVVLRGDSVWIIDAKYRSHFAEIDEAGWRRMSDDIRESHRADIHQVLAYASLFDSADIRATLAYPLRHSTWAALKSRGRDRSVAHIFDSRRQIRVELWGMPFGAAQEA